MTFAMDVNPLLYASDDTSPFRDRARLLLDEIAMGEDLVYLFWPVAMGFVRIATNPRVFRAPLTPEEAMSNIEGVIALPNVRTGAEDDEFFTRFRQVTGGMAVRGDLVPDAHIVALMKQFGLSEICTHDRDFARFRGIRIVDPFS